MTDGHKKNVNPLDKPPRLKIIRLNRMPLYLIGGLIILLFISAFMLLPERNTKSSVDESEIPTTTNQDDKRWYKIQSNALPKTTNRSYDDHLDRSLPIANINQSTQDQFNHQKIDTLYAAMNSPISTQNLQELAQFNHSLNTNRAPNIPDNSSFTQSGNELPLSREQVNKLQRLFGLNTSNSSKQKTTSTKNDLLSVDYLSTTVHKPLSPYEIKAGTIIPAVMISGINSDLPGQAIAQVRQNVYDTVRGKYLLIPQGSKLLIIYDNQIAYGQNRVLVTVKRIIFPNGNSLDLEGMPGTDVSGYSGFHDQVNNHYTKIFGNAALLGAISAGFQLSQPQQSSIFINPTTGQTMAAAMGQQMGQVGTNMINKNLNVQPTLVIRPGYEFNVTVTSDMILPGIYHDS